MMRLLSTAAALALCAVSPAAAAGPRPPSLIGKSVVLNYFYQANETTDTILVDNTREISCPGAYNVCQYLNTQKLQSLQIGASRITYRYNGPGTQFTGVTPNEFDFESLDLGKPIAAVVLTTNIPGLTAANITFSANSVQVNMTGLSVPGPKNYFTLVLKTRI